VRTLLKYKLSAELKGNVTTHPLEARGISGALVEAHEIIRKGKASDRRLERGNIKLFGPENELIMSIIDDVETIHVDTQEKKKGVDEDDKAPELEEGGE